MRTACGSAAEESESADGARRRPGTDIRPKDGVRGRECHGDPWQRLGNLDRGRIRPAAVRSRPLSYHHGRSTANRCGESSGIVETANGDLWLNGLGGIVHIRREEILEGLKDPAYQVSVERFDRRAGLPGLPSQLRHVPTAIEGTDGRLWFTVNNGVVSLDPTRASNRTPSPPVSIQSVTADDKVYEPDQLPRFPAGTSNVQISYAAVSLLNPEAIRFRYRLQEMDDEWHEAARSTSVSYRNLPPGSYHFRGRRQRCQRAMVGQDSNAPNSPSCRRTTRRTGFALCAPCCSCFWRGRVTSYASGGCIVSSR